MHEPLSSLENQEPVQSSSSSGNKRRYEHEPDAECIASSSKRRRVPHGSSSSSSSKKHHEELSDFHRNVAARTRNQNLKMCFAALENELPYRCTSRTQIGVLEEATGYIRRLKSEIQGDMEDDDEETKEASLEELE
ncbi:predicted protein [Lichtheimia corymbifera JMRC:FSU:9682]|uniref:BHLH domain-containing protein n=1 Tax=Lichtheimia corymbifera JMRC:FSU:9682 TaxID=1263082 RepID=A0A068RYH5_9FUNG|nr:predicted protein [Lichtheimia corymbifera JMRC:FSU:9682]